MTLIPRLDSDGCYYPSREGTFTSQNPLAQLSVLFDVFDEVAFPFDGDPPRRWSRGQLLVISNLWCEALDAARELLAEAKVPFEICDPILRQADAFFSRVVDETLSDGETDESPFVGLRRLQSRLHDLEIYTRPTWKNLREYLSAQVDGGGPAKSMDAWQAEGIAILWQHRDQIRKMADLHSLLQARGFKGNRRSLYKMESLCDAAKAAGVYSPRKAEHAPIRGFRTVDGVDGIAS